MGQSEICLNKMSHFSSSFSYLYLVLSVGKKSKSKIDESSDNSNNDKNNNKAHNGEVLDLRDLDLSQLRLTKKDLETLSSLTPSLSKSLQDQLFAQLPPNQAKKLSRTLSVQNGKESSESSQVYRRSISNNPREVANRYSRDSITPTNEVFDSLNNNSKNESRYRRSVSRDETLDDSVNNNARSSSDIKHQNRESTLSPTDFRGQYYSSLKSNSSRSTSVRSDIQRICFSPEPLDEKPKQKRLSRFISPEPNTGYELYDEPKKIEKFRQLESHKILRELVEKTREKSVEKEPMENRISYFLDKYATSEISKHLLNGSFQATEANQLKTSTRSETASSSHSHSSVSSTINDKILDELNSISLLNGQLERFDQKELQNQEKSLKKKVKSDGTIKKVVKKVKDKSPENSLEESRTEDLKLPLKRESKIARPKSFISKDSTLQLVKSSDKLTETVDAPSEFDAVKMPSKLARPKSFPNSKITPPKEIKFPDSLTNILNLPKELTPSRASANNEMISDGKGNNGKQQEVEPKKTKKVIKVVKKSSKSVIATATESESLLEPKVEAKREKSPEKKSGKGLLYTIGQKFEKLRETKSKDKKETETAAADMKEKKKKIKALLTEDVDEATRQERKSKIDAMIKNLKEKSLPRNTELTESGLIKRAVSVEEIPNTFNKNTVNKVLGLFKRIEKENTTSDAKVQNTKSTSYLSYNEYEPSTSSKERPKSSGFVHKIKKNGSAFEPLNNISESKIPVKYASTCPDCKESNEITESKSSNTVNKRHSSSESKSTIEEKERLKNNRKGLMLDFSKFNSIENESNEVKKSSSRHNNYSFPPPLPHEVGQNLTTPTYDSLTNYSSSPYDESSTLLSPTDDIGYDRWSTCSEEDHHPLPPHPLGTSSLSRLSRSIHSQAPLDETEFPESVVDRIRRKSFYSRFNEKKPKRVSNIVGPAAKDYYRERSRPLEYTKSATSIIPDLSVRNHNADSSIQHVRATSSTRHAAASSSSAASRSLSQTRASSKYSNDKFTDSLEHSNSYRRLNYESSHMTSLPPPHHHHHHHHDLLLKSPDDVSTRIRNNRSTMYDSSSSSSNTPSLTSLYAKRRSYVSTPSSSSGTTTFSSSSALKPPPSFVDGYATIGRKTRQYNSRSVSLLDPNTINSTNNYVNEHHHRVNGYADLNDTYSRFVSHTNNKLPTIRHNACY